MSAYRTISTPVTSVRYPDVATLTGGDVYVVFPVAVARRRAIIRPRGSSGLDCVSRCRSRHPHKRNVGITGFSKSSFARKGRW